MDPLDTAATQNIPNASLMFTMYTGAFGNLAFSVTPPDPKMQGGFPTVPYLSLEALLYASQASNPLSAPLNVLSGGTAGTQNIQGQQQITDSTGTVRMVSGFSQNGF